MNGKGKQYKMRDMSNRIDKLSLETMSIAYKRPDMRDVKKETPILMEKVGSLEQESITLNKESNVLEGKHSIHKEELGTLKNENTVKKDKESDTTKSDVDALRTDVQMLKSTILSQGGQCSNEQDSDFSNRNNDFVDNEENLAVGSNESSATEELRKRKREENEIFRNWQNTMAERKTSEVLWASGLLKITMELWEDNGILMDGEQILDFIKRNVEQLTTFISSEISKERFFLTLLKMCSMRNVSKQHFQEIILCFVNQGSLSHRITEPEVQKFIGIYKE